MSRTVETEYYYYIYSHDEEDMLWYSPSSADKAKCDKNLLNCIEEARRILRQNPSANIEIYGHCYDLCDGYEDGSEYDFTVCSKNQLDETERKIRK